MVIVIVPTLKDFKIEPNNNIIRRSDGSIFKGSITYSIKQFNHL